VRYAFMQVDDASVAALVAEELVGRPASPMWTRFDSLQAEVAKRGNLIGARRDTGYQDVAEAPPELVAAAKDMEQMTVGQVLMPDGSHMVFVLIDYRGERQLTLDEARSKVLSALRTERSEELLQKLLADLQTRYPVETHPELFGS
jgi:hypothetical protein